MNDLFKIIADLIKNRRSIKPVKMNGTVPGNTMLEKIFNRDAEKLRATLMNRTSLV